MAKIKMNKDELIEKLNHHIERLEKLEPLLDLFFSSTSNINEDLVRQLDRDLKSVILKYDNLEKRISAYRFLFVEGKENPNLVIQKFIDEFKNTIK